MDLMRNFEKHAPLAPDTLQSVWANIRRNPAEILARWNYKAAFLSATMRASIFLATYLQFAGKDASAKENLATAFGAAAAQFVFRFFYAGLNGSVVQSLRVVEPTWKALLTIMLVIPAVSHLLEFIVQHSYAALTGTTQNTDEAIVRSICVSIISALFNLFAMRRGVFLVRVEESKSIWGDAKHVPAVVAEFVAFIPIEVAKMLRRGDYFAALFGGLGFGAFSGLLAWVIRGKASWALPWATGAIILLLVGIGISAFVFSRKARRS